MTQVFLLGTFHFNQSEIDFYTEETQRQLWDINERLLKFKPDAVAIECPAHAQESVDTSYQKFSVDDLSNYEKMRNESLGTIFMFGNTHPILYKYEQIQVGYRLGKTIGANKVYAADDDTALGIFPEEETPEHVKRDFDKHWQKMLNADKHETILDKFKHINSDELSYHNHQLYVVKNVVGAGGSYAGADWFGRWYMRNLKFFANLQKLCENHERIFALYGAGHLYILRELINLCEYMELADYKDYL